MVDSISLKNINFMNNEQFNSLEEVKDDEIYLVECNLDTQLPNQENNSGKFLSTDGSNAHWEDLPQQPVPMNITFRIYN